jgi:hypothetical protein
MKRKKVNKYLLPDIPAIENFKECFEKYCENTILNKDPIYFEKIYRVFDDYSNNNPKLRFTHEHVNACIPFLNKDFYNLAILLGSLYEVKRGWLRLLEVYSVIQNDSPVTNESMNETRWWKYCEDSLWFADYGYLEKLMSFLKIIQRYLNKTDKTINYQFIDDSINIVKDLRDVTAKARDPIAHSHSITVDDRIYETFWQLYLAIGYKIKFNVDPLEALDSFIALDRKNTTEQAYKWLKSNYIITSRIFTQLEKLLIFSCN